jgi:hypothetical protein
MADEKIRSYLRRALDEVSIAEKNRVSEILNDADVSISKGIEKMMPLIQLLNALKDEVGTIEGLEISPAAKGHMATVRTKTSVTNDSYSISTNYDNSKYTIDEFSSFSIDGSYREEKNEYETVEDVMAKVIDLVGKHIGAAEAQSEIKNA